MFELLPPLKQRFFDSDGNPLAGGLLYSYQAGTTTPQTTYTDESGTNPNTNPIVLDSTGSANVWINPNTTPYKFILTDSSGAVQFSVDNVSLNDLANGVQSVNGVSGAVTVNAISQLTGDVTTAAASQTQSLAATVASVGGSTAANVHTAEQIVNNPQSGNVVLASPSSGASGAPAFRAIVAADIPTLNQNTTGTASNITATSNSTLATLSALSLPYGQLSGTVPTWNQNTTGTSSNITGVAAIAHGGTGQATQQAAMNALAGTQVSGKYLRSDGTNTTLSTIQAADVPTLNQSTTGNAATATSAGSFTGSLAGDVSGTQSATSVNKINGVSLSGLSTGILKNTTATGVPSIAVASDFPTLNQNTTGTAANVSGTVAIANGGTGQTSASAAINALVPSQSGNSGLVLSTNGTSVLWASGGSSLPSQTGQSGNYLTTNGTTASWAPVSGGGGGGVANNAHYTGNGLGTIAGGAFAYNVVDYDTYGNYNTTTGRWTPTVAGCYQFNARLYTGGGQNLYLYKNGSVYSQGQGGSSVTPTTISDIMYLNGSTDYAFFYTDTGGTTSGGTALNDMTISLIGGSGSTGISRSVANISTATSAGATVGTDYVYLVSGTTTITLPTALSNSNLYTIKNVGSGTVTVATTSSQTIDGSSTATLPVANTSFDLISDGTNWRII